MLCNEFDFMDDCKTNVRVSLFQANSKSALYQGTTSVVPKKAPEVPFSAAACRKPFVTNRTSAALDDRKTNVRVSLFRAQSKKCFVSGHDFSRAEKRQ
jgi:hypothetical protein